MAFLCEVHLLLSSFLTPLNGFELNQHCSQIYYLSIYQRIAAYEQCPLVDDRTRVFGADIDLLRLFCKFQNFPCKNSKKAVFPCKEIQITGEGGGAELIQVM